MYSGGSGGTQADMNAVLYIFEFRKITFIILTT